MPPSATNTVTTSEAARLKVTVNCAPLPPGPLPTAERVESAPPPPPPPSRVTVAAQPPAGAQ